METNIDPTTSLASTISEAVCQKIASAPLFPFPLKPEDTQLTTQISAPFYLFSLKTNRIGEFLVEKKIVLNYNLSEKSFLTGLLTETVDYAAQRDFSAFELACLITIYLDTHLFFKYYYWLSPAADSPDGQEVFGPEECYDILTHFHAVYLSNLPL
ncbi:XK-related protein, partial [Operophtera brumata]